MRTVFLLLLACAAAACGADSPARDSLVAVVDTVNGVERLSYPADAATPLAWHFDTLAVIGGAMVDDENYQFQTGAMGLAGNADGDLFLSDTQGKRVLRYDSTGTFVRSYGREGAGPGELRFPMAVRLGPGDSIWVTDTGNRRITIYDAADGGSRTLGPANAQNPSPTQIALAGGHLYQLGAIAFSGSGRGADEPPPTPLLRSTLDGTPLDTLWLGSPQRWNTVTLRSGTSMTMIMIPETFAPQFRWAVLSDGRVVVSDSVNYVLHIVAPDGTLERTIRRDPPARATTDADREAAREEERTRAANASGLTGSDEFLRQRLESMTFADVIPRITNLAVDPQDRIWVGVSVDTPEKTERIDVYDASGRLIGEIRDPAFFPRLLYGPGLAARLTTDELDVDQVVVMRVVE